MASANYSTVKNLYQRSLPVLGLGIAFSLPIKLALTYIFFIPAVALWIAAQIVQWRGAPGPSSGGASRSSPVGLPLLTFLLIAALSACFGVNPARSLQKIPAFIFAAMSVFMFVDIARTTAPARLLTALLCGQAVAAFYSLFESAFRGNAPQLFIGTVTESGQITLSLLAGCGLALYAGTVSSTAEGSAHSAAKPHTFAAHRRLWTLGSFIVFCLVAFFPHLKQPLALFIPLAAAGAAILGGGLYIGLRALFAGDIRYGSLKLALVIALLPVISAALLANLKRGPWVGVLVGVTVLCLHYRKKLILPMLAGAAAAFVFIPPVSTRLSQSSHDFFVTGGRSVMWEIGGELALRYPLGIGLGNSRFLREFAPEIPPQLTHFHNNYINILVETGWVGLGVFLWWMITILKTAFSASSPKDSPLRIGIGCAIVAWLTAGLVEYSFGDSEVVKIIFLLVGVLGGMSGASSTENAEEK